MDARLAILAGLVTACLTGCQLFEKNRDTNSACYMKCADCKGLTVECDHNTNRTNSYSINHPDDDGVSDENDQRTVPGGPE